MLIVSYIKTKRIWRSFRLYGERSVISKKRKNRNHSLDLVLEQRMIELTKSHYADYGATLLAETLEKFHQIKMTKETVRKLLIKHGLRRTKKRKKVKVYQRRKRRSSCGKFTISRKAKYYFKNYY